MPVNVGLDGNAPGGELIQPPAVTQPPCGLKMTTISGSPLQLFDEEAQLPHPAHTVSLTSNTPADWKATLALTLVPLTVAVAVKVVAVAASVKVNVAVAPPAEQLSLNRPVNVTVLPIG